MLVIDENVSEIEVWRLREWGIAVRQIGPDIASASITDDNILPALLRLKRPTLFTRDEDFFKPRLAHKKYSLVYLDVREHEGVIAAAIRQFLRHPVFDTHAKRMGKVIRIRPTVVSYWQLAKSALHHLDWQSQ